jgi:transposase
MSICYKSTQVEEGQDSGDERRATTDSGSVGPSQNLASANHVACLICLMAADGVSNNAIARALKTTRPTVIQRRRRFATQGAARLADEEPMKKGRCGTMTHDCKRNGTTCLYAALNVLEGKVICSCYPRHRHVEFLKFLRQIDRETPLDLDIHLILDNYGTHKHPKVKARPARHLRFHLHFTPISSSWLNLVERWFGEIAHKRLRRGSFRSVTELVATIGEYIRMNDEAPEPFVRTKKADTVLGKVSHCKAVTGTLH